MTVAHNIALAYIDDLAQADSLLSKHLGPKHPVRLSIAELKVRAHEAAKRSERGSTQSESRDRQAATHDPAMDRSAVAVEDAAAQSVAIEYSRFEASGRPSGVSD